MGYRLSKIHLPWLEDLKLPTHAYDKQVMQVGQCLPVYSFIPLTLPHS